MTEVKNCNNRLLMGIDLPRLRIPQRNVIRDNEHLQQFYDINNGNFPPPAPQAGNNLPNPFDGHNRGGQV